MVKSWKELWGFLPFFMHNFVERKMKKLQNLKFQIFLWKPWQECRREFSFCVPVFVFVHNFILMFKLSRCFLTVHDFLAVPAVNLSPSTYAIGYTCAYWWQYNNHICNTSHINDSSNHGDGNTAYNNLLWKY